MPARSPITPHPQVRTLLGAYRSPRTGKLEEAGMLRLMRHMLPGLSGAEAR